MKGSTKTLPNISTPRDTNALLAAMPRSERAHLREALKPVDLPVGTVLYKGGGNLRHVLFVNAGLVSLIYTTLEGITVEAGLIGRDGLLGLHALLGAKTTPTTAIVQMSGQGLRMTIAAAREAFNRGGHFQQIVLRYAAAFLAHLSQASI